jgi:hypothetical protein
MWRRAGWAALLFALVATSSGCGDRRSDDRAIEATVARHLQAIDGGRFAEACGQLTEAARDDLVAFFARGGVPRPPTCESAYRLLLTIGSADFARGGVMDRAAYSNGVYRVRVIQPHVDDRATARVNGSRKTVALDRSEGDWRISRLDFSGLPGS